MKKIILGILLIAVAYTVVANQNEPEIKKNTDIIINSRVQTGAVDFDLTAGNYIVGIDIPAGEYNLKAEKNSGKIVVTSMYDKGIIIDMAVKKADLVKETFDNLKLAAPMDLNITGKLKVKFISKNATLQPYKKVKIEGKEIVLNSGMYTVGKDIVPGVYNVSVVDGTGNVSSLNTVEGGINEVFSVNNKDYGIEKFNNLLLKKGTKIKIEGKVLIKLVPSKREFIK